MLLRVLLMKIWVHNITPAETQVLAAETFAKMNKAEVLSVEFSQADGNTYFTLTGNGWGDRLDCFFVSSNGRGGFNICQKY